MLEKLPPAARRLVLGAVALHNRRSLPRGLPRELKDLTQMVRDADKLDIFQVMLAHFTPGARHNKVVNLELKPDPDEVHAGDTGAGAEARDGELPGDGLGE